jgi:hypothetical protein
MSRQNVDRQLYTIVARRKRKLTPEERAVFDGAGAHRRRKLRSISRAMAAYRKRRKAGTRVFKLYATVRFLDAMVQEGFLPPPTCPEDVTNDKVVEAIYWLLNAWRKQRREKEAAGGGA